MLYSWACLQRSTLLGRMPSKRLRPPSVGSVARPGPKPCPRLADPPLRTMRDRSAEEAEGKRATKTPTKTSREWQGRVRPCPPVPRRRLLLLRAASSAPRSRTSRTSDTALVDASCSCARPTNTTAVDRTARLATACEVQRRSQVPPRYGLGIPKERRTDLGHDRLPLLLPSQ